MNPQDLLEALKQRGVDTDAVIQKLDQMGYDTTPLGGVKPSTKGNLQSALKQAIPPIMQGLPQAAAGAGMIINKAQQAEQNIPGVRQAIETDPIMRGALLQGQADKAGEDIATSKFGQAHPNLGAAIGTAVQMAPDIGMGMAGTAGAPALAQGIEEAGAPLKMGAQFIKQRLGQLGETFKAPGEAEARNLGQQMMARNAPQAVERATAYSKNVVGDAFDRIAALKTSLKKLPVVAKQEAVDLEQSTALAKKALQQSEEEAGLGFKPDAEFESKLKDKTAMRELVETMSKINKMTPEQIGKIMPPETRHYFNKLGQEAVKQPGAMSDFAVATTQQARQKLAQSIAKDIPQIGQRHRELVELYKAADRLPIEQAARKAAVQQELIKAQETLKEMQIHATQVINAAKKADAAQLADLNMQRLKLIQLGIKHDKLISKIRNAVIGTAAGAAGLKGLHYLKG